MKKLKKINKGLVYVILLCLIGLVTTAIFLYMSMEEVKELTSHKTVLMDRLAEEVFAKQLLQKEVDSLNQIIESKNPPAIVSDMQAVTNY